LAVRRHGRSRRARSKARCRSFLHSGGQAAFAKQVPAFLEGLAAGGLIEGRDVAIEYRWANGQFDRLPALADEFVSRKVNAIAAFAPPAAAAAKAATTTILVVLISGLDPVRAGFVASLNRPGGNVTGFYNFGAHLGPKRLGMLAELVPVPALIGILINPDNPDAATEIAEIQNAAMEIGRRIVVLNANSESTIDAAFTALAERRAGALYVATGSFYLDQRSRIAALAERHRIPAIYPFREAAEAGGLMSYGIDLLEGVRQVGVYTARILKGEKPGDLPVVQSTKFEFIINLKTARMLNLDISPTLLARADEVIE
jgi:putative ABC transport system substrate-binding protein